MAVATGHIDPRVGNLMFVGLVGGIGAVAILAAAVWASKRNIPFLTNVADAGLDVIREAAK